MESFIVLIERKTRRTMKTASKPVWTTTPKVRFVFSTFSRKTNLECVSLYECVCVCAGWLTEGPEGLSRDDQEKVQHTFTEVTMTLFIRVPEPSRTAMLHLSDLCCLYNDSNCACLAVVCHAFCLIYFALFCFFLPHALKWNPLHATIIANQTRVQSLFISSSHSFITCLSGFFILSP